MQGFLSKMDAKLIDGLVHYTLALDEPVAMNALLGKTIRLEFLGHMRCVGCGRAIKKTFQQGYCFPCVQTKAACDLCIVKPERCHFHKGTCREPAWGEAHCMKTHVVYLANTSGLKVGITRIQNVPQRFIDQGATAALPIFEVATRLDSGLIEVEIAKTLADKTNWRKMLQGDNVHIDLEAAREELIQQLGDSAFLQDMHSVPSTIGRIDLNYPVLNYPSKITSLNLDKAPVIEGVLEGIKGQYLLLSTGVFNVRNATGYAVSLGFSD